MSDPYFSTGPQIDPEQGGRSTSRRTLAIILCVLLIPLLVAAALGMSGNGGDSSTKPCGAGEPGCPATTTSPWPTLPGVTDTVPTTTTPEMPVVTPPPVIPETPSNGGSLPPTIVFPPPPPSPPAPPPPPAPSPPPAPAPPPPPPPSPTPPPSPIASKLVRSDGGQAIFQMPNAGAGHTVSRCITITYKGSASARVRLYGIRSGTGLDQYINLKVTRGSTPEPAGGSCSGFQADSTNYIGQGQGVMFNGLLSTFATTFTAASDEPTQADRERWTNSERHTYRFQITLQSNNAAQGLTVSQAFTWDARAY